MAVGARMDSGWHSTWTTGDVQCEGYSSRCIFRRSARNRGSARIEEAVALDRHHQLIINWSRLNGAIEPFERVIDSPGPRWIQAMLDGGTYGPGRHLRERSRRVPRAAVCATPIDRRTEVTAWASGSRTTCGEGRRARSCGAAAVPHSCLSTAVGSTCNARQAGAQAATMATKASRRGTSR